MDEEDILFLEELGYKVENGFITTQMGEYVPEVSSGGKTVTSLWSAEDYAMEKAEEEELKAIGFQADPLNMEYSERQQGERAITKARLGEFDDNPSFETYLGLPKELTQEDVFSEFKEEKQDQNT